MWKQWLARLDNPRGEQHPAQEVALAVLLLECARADFEHSPAELDTVRAALSAQLDVPDAELDALIEQARALAAGAVSLHNPVTRLNRELSAERKRELMGWLWRVAAADGRIDPHEDHLLRRLADLLHVAHADFIRSKLAALERAPT